MTLPYTVDSPVTLLPPNSQTVYYLLLLSNDVLVTSAAGLAVVPLARSFVRGFSPPATIALSLWKLVPSGSLIRFQSIEVPHHHHPSFSFQELGLNHLKWPVSPYYRLLLCMQLLLVSEGVETSTVSNSSFVGMPCSTSAAWPFRARQQTSIFFKCDHRSCSAMVSNWHRNNTPRCTSVECWWLSCAGADCWTTFPLGFFLLLGSTSP